MYKTKIVLTICLSAKKKLFSTQKCQWSSIFLSKDSCFSVVNKQTWWQSCFYFPIVYFSKSQCWNEYKFWARWVLWNVFKSGKMQLRKHFNLFMLTFYLERNQSTWWSQRYVVTSSHWTWNSSFIDNARGAISQRFSSFGTLSCIWIFIFIVYFSVRPHSRCCQLFVGRNWS